MKIVKWILISIVAVVGLAAIVGAFLPTEFKIARSIIINADSATIHTFLGDLNKWEEWTPWKENDPSIVITQGDKTSGIGASQSWTGDSSNGKLIFTSSSPEKGIEYDLIMDDGEFKCKSAMLYNAEENGTQVTWTMSGDMEIPIIGGYFAIMMDLMAGKMFDQGLQNLKQVVE